MQELAGLLTALSRWREDVPSFEISVAAIRIGLLGRPATDAETDAKLDRTGLHKGKMTAEDLLEWEKAGYPGTVDQFLNKRRKGQ